jgi:hypothetical protein
MPDLTSPPAPVGCRQCGDTWRELASATLTGEQLRLDLLRVEAERDRLRAENALLREVATTSARLHPRINSPTCDLCVVLARWEALAASAPGGEG